jgi:hypothetical protein
MDTLFFRRIYRSEVQIRRFLCKNIIWIFFLRASLLIQKTITIICRINFEFIYLWMKDDGSPEGFVVEIMVA